MDPVLEKLTQMTWGFADQDELAYQKIAARVADAGRSGKPLSYSDLASGIEFHLPNREMPHVIDVNDWTMLDRKIIGEFLGRLSAETYLRGRVFGSAIVVGKNESRPSEGFYTLMEQLGLIRSKNSAKREELWIREYTKAMNWYKSNDW